MGWLAALAVLTALSLIPVGASLRYQGEEFLLKIRVAFLTFSLSSKNGEKEKKEKKPQKEPLKQTEPKTAGKGSPNPPAQKKKKQRRPLSDYMPFVRLGLDFLGSLRRKLRIEKLWLKIVLAGDDPCDLAVNYGKVWGGLSALMASLNQVLVIKDQNVDVQCDFVAEKTTVSARLDLTITIGKLLALALGYGARALKELLIFKKRKGGATI